jgi:hypothetical protein
MNLHASDTLGGSRGTGIPKDTDEVSSLSSQVKFICRSSKEGLFAAD